MPDDCHFLCHDVTVKDQISGRQGSWFARQKISTEFLPVSMANGGYPFSNPCGQVYNREIMETVGRWLSKNEWTRGAENPIAWGALLLSGKVYYIQDRLANYRIHGDNFFMESNSRALSPKIDWLERWPRLIIFLDHLIRTCSSIIEDTASARMLLDRLKKYHSDHRSKKMDVPKLDSHTHRLGAPEGPAGNDSMRMQWINHICLVAGPVLNAASQATLHVDMPCEERTGANRATYSSLEAFGRTLAGIGPWLAKPALDPHERERQKICLTKAQLGLSVSVDPKSPAFLNFSSGPQPLVDSAYLAQAIMRSPEIFWEPMDVTTKRNIASALGSTRSILPYNNNWILFSAMIEAFFVKFGFPFDAMRIDRTLRQMDLWYVGDGVYGDGPRFRFDYYNSYVIHPFLLDILAAVNGARAWRGLEEKILLRAQRYSELLERQVAPDGTMPIAGRSLAYRCGSLNILGHLALIGKLPVSLKPAQVRMAMSAVIQRTLSPSGTFDQNGWLRIGHCGHQPSIGEKYISTGSLYLAALAFLPLGLHSNAAFWSSEPEPFTSQKIYSGMDVKADEAPAWDHA